jgi:hypothetical protein
MIYEDGKFSHNCSPAVAKNLKSELVLIEKKTYKTHEKSGVGSKHPILRESLIDRPFGHVTTDDNSNKEYTFIL